MVLRATGSLLLLAAGIARTTAQRNCWFPDGNTETIDVPCNTNADESACCGPTAFCLSNGLCLDSGVVSRGSCTDRTWNSSACAQQCTDENLDSGLSLINCDARMGTWICATNGNSCTDAADVFPIDTTEMNQITARPAGNGDPILLTPNATDASGPSTSAGDNGTATVTVTTLSSSTAASDAEFTSAQMAGVGAGVGVPLLLCLLGAIFVITRQRRRLRAAEAFAKENEAKATQPSVGGGYGGQQQQAPMAYGHFAPEQKMQNSGAAYYRPISPSPPAGHFREVEAVPEMDGGGRRPELEGMK